MKRFALLSLFALAGCGGGTPQGAALAPPSNLTVEPLGSGLHVAWADDSADEAEFQIERKSTGSFSKIASVVFDTTQYHDSAVTPATAYTYRVRAVSASASSSYTTEVTQTAPGSGADAGAGGGSGGGTGGGSGGGAAGGGIGGSGGMGGGAGGGGVVNSLPDGGYSFQQHIVPIFNSSCGAGDNNCHSRLAYGPTAAGACRGWLALENAALGSKNPTTMAATGCPDRTLWQRLTDLDSWMCEPTKKKYITAKSLTASQVYQAIIGNAAGGGGCNKAPNVPLPNMPPGVTLDPVAVKKIETWIMQGAPNN